MYWDVKLVKPLKDYRIYVEIENGKKGIFDLKPYLNHGIFKELQNVDYFNQVEILYGAVTWSNGQDIEPQTLLDELENKIIPIKVIKVTPIDNYKLIVEFENSIIKQYDMSKLLNLEVFKPLENKFLFKQARVDTSGYGVIWNDEIDISEYELWENGTLYAAS